MSAASPNTNPPTPLVQSSVVPNTNQVNSPATNVSDKSPKMLATTNNSEIKAPVKPFFQDKLETNDTAKAHSQQRTNSPAKP
jgi:hypothetical protein